MKLTKSKLKQIIKEEIQSLLKEDYRGLEGCRPIKYRMSTE